MPSEASRSTSTNVPVGAIGVSEAAGGGDVLTVDRARARRGSEIDALDPEIAKLGELAGIADAVVVGILPDHQLTERRIVAVDHTVMVGVEARKRRDAVGEVAARKGRREQLVAALDLAGTVDVEGKDAVVARRSRRPGPSHRRH